jgi:CheY-like chemotaxis protein
MRILVVDNDPVYLNLLAEVLRLHSFETVTAPNGEVALECMQREEVDLIISDISMPRMNGMALHRAVRTNPQLRSIPFAWNSGYRELREALELGDTTLDYKLDKAMPLPSLLYFVSRFQDKKSGKVLAAA